MKLAPFRSRANGVQFNPRPPMILRLALLTQIATLATARTPAPVRVWRTDSTVTVSLHDAGYVTLLHVSADGRISVLFPLEPGLDTWVPGGMPLQMSLPPEAQGTAATFVAIRDRKSTRLNSSHLGISYAVFCLKKKKKHVILVISL